MARKPFCVTDELRKLVRFLAARGLRQTDIAKMIGCRDPKTLRRHFRDELDLGTAEVNVEVAGYLLNAAKGGSVAAAIFWLKSRAGWREKEPEKPIPNSDAEQNSHTIIGLPDNNRDPELTEELQKAQQRYFDSKQRRQQR